MIRNALRYSLPAVLAAALALGCGEEEPTQGELMLSVTTDMAVPADIDTLVWTITLNGETTPFASDAVSLTSGEDLPVTLAIAAGPKTTGPITLRVEGRKGGEAEPVRVMREARLKVPTDRVALLHMPLSWLCSDANLTEACPERQTCRAGTCVDAAIATDSLPDYAEPTEYPCFDVTACFDQPTLTPASPDTEDPEAYPCTVAGSTPLGANANVNVAIEVDNDAVGNYGFCGQYGECFIPLSRTNEAEGWQVLRTGDTPAIRLPDAVCGKANVSRIALLRPSAACPINRGERPLCTAPPDACLNAEICPPTWPADAWAGYACSGTANPFQTDPNLVKCWSPGEDASHERDDGRWCCLKGQALSEDPLLIDDMSGGPQIKLEPRAGDDAGWWFASLPEGSGDLSPAPDPALYTYRAIEPPVTPVGGPEIRTAACLKSSGFLGWLALQGFFFASKQGEYGARALDLKSYKGLSFWGWADTWFPGASLDIRVAFPNVQASTEPGSECLSSADGENRCDNFFKTVSLTSTWTKYTVSWDELRQSRDDFGQIRFEEFDTRTYATVFSARGAGTTIMSQPFDFCVAHIRFEE